VAPSARAVSTVRGDRSGRGASVSGLDLVRDGPFDRPPLTAPLRLKRDADRLTAVGTPLPCRVEDSCTPCASHDWGPPRTPFGDIGPPRCLTRPGPGSIPPFLSRSARPAELGPCPVVVGAGRVVAPSAPAPTSQLGGGATTWPGRAAPRHGLGRDRGPRRVLLQGGTVGVHRAEPDPRIGTYRGSVRPFGRKDPE
jgi:hypothetical protein